MWNMTLLAIGLFFLRRTGSIRNYPQFYSLFEFPIRSKKMQIHQLVLFSFVGLAASAPVAEDKRSGILDGYESAGDMDFPNAPKNEPTQEPDRLFNGIYIPHTIEWKIPPHRRSEAETDLSSGGAKETEDDIEDYIVATMKELYRIRKNGDNPFIDGFSSSKLCPYNTKSCLGIFERIFSETFANLPQGVKPLEKWLYLPPETRHGSQPHWRIPLIVLCHLRSIDFIQNDDGTAPKHLIKVMVLKYTTQTSFLCHKTSHPKMRFQQFALFSLVALAAAVPLSGKDNRVKLASEASLSRKNEYSDISARATIPGIRGEKVNLILRGETAANGTGHGSGGEGGKQGGGGNGGGKDEEGEEGGEGEEDEEGDDEEGDDEEGEGGDGGKGDDGKGEEGHKGPHGGKHGHGDEHGQEGRHGQGGEHGQGGKHGQEGEQSEGGQHGHGNKHGQEGQHSKGGEHGQEEQDGSNGQEAKGNMQRANQSR
ncbi:hypothetical protein AO1008_02922 [Aspergillus oryzae 100-8]|uniref:Uncharacterized protein n=2 Tax=Aspergillus subgen. Circumdati TaxID=2720871 RepID=I8IPJ5_ASPO3|nr:hypothetical protein Ao3042_02318 [Aspergillus oryzae 3.042]KDE85835.1 hypothetical protein AO1008_02922 [Aspergillus oryzae 100-8]|eukprot:EIT81236.1 hypothetical protein Ao3042_02318 [Aspergillus oryzae 3.042]